MRSRPVCKELLKLKFCAFVCGMGRHLILYRVCLNRYWFIITHWPLSFQNLYIVIANQGYIARKKSIQSYFFFLFIWSQFALWDTFLDCIHALKFIWSFFIRRICNFLIGHSHVLEPWQICSWTRESRQHSFLEGSFFLFSKKNSD